MPSVDILKQMRSSGYADKPSEMPKKEEEESGNRLIKLTDDEVKSLGEYKDGDQTCTVTGTMTDGGMFRVLSVAPAGQPEESQEQPGMEQMIKSVMG